MTDRELLEAAARASGVGHTSFIGGAEHYSVPAEWDPLTDDGDALRLAVKLCMHVEVWPDIVSVTTTHRATGDEDASEQAGSDLNAATRRAIVRVAAAMAVR